MPKALFWGVSTAAMTGLFVATLHAFEVQSEEAFHLEHMKAIPAKMHDGDIATVHLVKVNGKKMIAIPVKSIPPELREELCVKDPVGICDD